MERPSIYVADPRIEGAKKPTYINKASMSGVPQLIVFSQVGGVIPEELKNPGLVLFKQSCGCDILILMFFDEFRF